MKTELKTHISETAVLSQISVRLIQPEEITEWNALIDAHHYLSSKLVGPTLRYVAELDGQWVGLFSVGMAAYHLRDRDTFIGWTDVQRGRRLSLIGQNTRFLILMEPRDVPNLASRILGLVTPRVSADWQLAFGKPLVALETFVDPQFFQGTCYKASGWERLGQTEGYGRTRRDFYQPHNRPKEIWFKVLDHCGFHSLKSQQLPADLAPFETEWRVCPFNAPSCDSLFNLYSHMTDHRMLKGRRYRLATLMSIITLAVLCGFSGHRSISSFAQKLTPSQCRQLRLPKRKDGSYRIPKETCIRDILIGIDAEMVEDTVAKWMAGLDETELIAIAIDGKTLKGTFVRNEEGEKKDAIHLVSAVNQTNARLIAQEQVESKSNEITAVDALIDRLSHLDGITITTDALSCLNRTALLIAQKKGAYTTSG